MNKKLPNIFKGTVDKSNNQDISLINKDVLEEVDVKKQINNIQTSNPKNEKKSIKYHKIICPNFSYLIPPPFDSAQIKNELLIK